MFFKVFSFLSKYVGGVEEEGQLKLLLFFKHVFDLAIVSKKCKCSRQILNFTFLI